MGVICTNLAIELGHHLVLFRDCLPGNQEDPDLWIGSSKEWEIPSLVKWGINSFQFTISLDKPFDKPMENYGKLDLTNQIYAT